VRSDTLGDILERVLDKGVVIAGDIKIKLVDIELLTIQIRLVIASVDKAKEMGIDWWVNNSYLSSKAGEQQSQKEIAVLKERIGELEAAAPRQGAWPKAVEARASSKRSLSA
jgi:hypothetical protein